MHYKCLAVTVDVTLLGMGRHTPCMKMVIATEGIQEDAGGAKAICKESLTHAAIKTVLLDSMSAPKLDTSAVRCR